MFGKPKNIQNTNTNLIPQKNSIFYQSVSLCTAAQKLKKRIITVYLEWNAEFLLVT